MELTQVFGKGFVDDLNESVLVVGKDAWSRRALASELNITNLVAARKLSAFCAGLRVKSARELYEKTNPYTFAQQGGIGLTTMYVAWMLFRALDLDPEAWYVKGEKGAVKSFLTYKHREQKAERRTKRARRRRVNSNEERVTA